MIKDGGGTLVLTRDEKYTGGTIIKAGTLQIGNGGDTGMILGNVKDDGTLKFDRTALNNAFTFSGDISGTGSLVQAGKATLMLTGNNTYTGGTTINNFTSLQVGDGATSGWITGDVTDNGTLIFARSDDVTFNGTVSGSGVLKVDGAGKVTLTADNTYTGGTQIAIGALEVAAGASLGTGNVSLNSGALFVDPGLSLNNIMLMDGGTLDNAGVLTGTSGQNPVQLPSDCTGFCGWSTLNNHDGGVIQGATLAVDMIGNITNDGVGSKINSPNGIAIQLEPGSNTSSVVNSGGGLISGKTIAISLPSGGTVTNDAGSTIEATGAGGYSIYVPSSSSSFFQLTNNGTIIGNVQGGNLGGATLSAGSVIRGNLELGSSAGLTLDGNAGTTQLFSQAVTGTTAFGGLLIKSGAGTWIIDTNNLSTDFGIQIRGGTLQIGTGGTVGMFGQGGVDITSDGALVFDRSDNVTFGGPIDSTAYTGTGVLEQAGTGILTLTNTQILLDVIKIDSGTLQIGNGGAGATSINADIIDNGSLVLDTSNDLYISKAITGTGSLTKTGTGTLYVAPYSGNTSLNPPNSNTGGTFIEQGTLYSGQSLPGDVSVASAGVFDATAGQSGTNIPGVDGNLSNAGKVVIQGFDTPVGGNYVQSSTGTLAVSLGSALTVTGTATLNGGTLEITGADSGYVSNSHTNVLTATGGVSGTFTNLVKDSGVVFTSTTINYGANSVWLDTTGLNITTAAAGGAVVYTPASMSSAIRVQGAFDQLNAKIASGHIHGVSNSFLVSAGHFQQAPNLQAAQSSLTSLSGQLHVAAPAMVFKSIDASNVALSDRFADLISGTSAYGMWTRKLDMGGDMVQSGFDSVGFQMNGWMVGSDQPIGSSGVAGYAFGQNRGQQRLAGSINRDDSHSTEGVMYAGWYHHNAYVFGRFGVGQYRLDMNRSLLLGYTQQGVGTNYQGNYSALYGETGLRIATGPVHVTPFLDMGYQRSAQSGFAEQGAGGFGLRSHAQVLGRLQAGVGMRADHRWNFGHGRFVELTARAQWQRTVRSHGDAFNASFVGMQQWAPLVGIGLSRRHGLYGIGMNAYLSRHAALKFNLDHELGTHGSAQMISAHLNLTF